MKKISVNLYGGKDIFGGREKPLNADVVFCDKTEKCSFYKNGSCFRTSRLGSSCKFGKTKYVKGYTSRAMKYYEFKRKWEKDEHYGALNNKTKIIGEIDDYIVLDLKHVHWNDDLEFKVTFGFYSTLAYIPKEHFTNDVIKRICDYHPRTLMGDGYIKSYQEEKIPKFLDTLKRDFNDIYKRFTEEFPEYDELISFIGRKAFIYSLEEGVKIKNYEKDNYYFTKKGEYLISDEYLPTFVPFDAKKCEVKIKIDNSMTTKIESDEQVSENTIFAD